MSNLRLFSVFRRYTVFGYLAVTSVLLLSLVIVISISMMVEDNLWSRNDINVLNLIQIILLRALSYAYQLIPIAAFLGVLVWGAMTAKRGELTALYVGGYSTWEISRPLIGTALFLSLLTLFTGEVLIPRATNKLIAMRGLDVTARQQTVVQEQWFRDGDYIIYLPAVDNDTKEMLDARIIKMTADGSVSQWYTGRRLRFQPDGILHWQLEDGVRYSLDEEGQITKEAFNAAIMPLTVSLDDLLDRSGRPGQLNSYELKSAISRRKRTGRIIRYHVFEYHNRLVYPLSLLVLVLISIPMALKPDKNRSISGAIGSGTVVAGWAYGVTYLFRSMMSSGSMGPIMASWGSLAAILIGALAAYVLIKHLFN